MCYINRLFVHSYTSASSSWLLANHSLAYCDDINEQIHDDIIHEGTIIIRQASTQDTRVCSSLCRVMLVLVTMIVWCYYSDHENYLEQLIVTNNISEFITIGIAICMRVIPYAFFSTILPPSASDPSYATQWCRPLTIALANNRYHFARFFLAAGTPPPPLLSPSACYLAYAYSYWYW